MMSLPILAMCVALTGCTTTPSPTEEVVEGNSQVRLTEAKGSVEGRTGLFNVNGGVQGDSCILTVLGELPPVKAHLKKGGCEVEWDPHP